MKSNFIHVAFVIDESGSMAKSTQDVVSSFNQMLKEHREEKEGTCSISFYTFNTYVRKRYLLKDINEVEDIVGSRVSPVLNNYIDVGGEETSENVYKAWGSTAMNDGIGQAITEIGEALAMMPEEERPEQNLIVIMTDGYENSSKKFSLPKIKEMINHQESVYNWKFVYMGTDITSISDAINLGISTKCYSTRENLKASIDSISHVTLNMRKSVGDIAAKLNTTAEALNLMEKDMNTKYTSITGIKLEP